MLRLFCPLATVLALQDPGPVGAALDLGRGDLFGDAACAIGDVDGDGIGDVLVGAWRVPGATTVSSGVVTLLSGRDGRCSGVWRAPEGRHGYGGALAGGVDLDGDGVGDAAIGAFGRGPGAGAVELRSARHGSLVATLRAPADEASFGSELAFVPDLDGDGVGDLAVYTRAERPRIALYSTRGAERLRTLACDEPGGRFGTAFVVTSAAAADPRDELLVSVDPADPRTPAAIAAFSLRSGERRWSHRFRSEQTSDAEPLAVGDFDGDGRVDFAHVAAELDGSSRVAFVTIASRHEFAGDIELARGDEVRLVATGDVDADGATDLIVARDGGYAHAEVRLYSGRTRRLLIESTGGADWIENRSLGASILVLGDVDADGVDDLLLGDANPENPSVPGCVEACSVRTGALVWRQTLAAALAGNVHTPRQ